MGWIRCIRCENFRGKCVARTFALVRPVCTEFRKATKRSRMHTNSTKRTKTSVQGTRGWNGCVCCKKNLTRLRGMNVCTSSARFAPSFVRQPNGPESTKLAPKCQFRDNGVDRVRSLRKIPTRLCGTNFCTSSVVLHRVS